MQIHSRFYRKLLSIYIYNHYFPGLLHLTVTSALCSQLTHYIILFSALNLYIIHIYEDLVAEPGSLPLAQMIMSMELQYSYFTGGLSNRGNVIEIITIYSSLYKEE